MKEQTEETLPSQEQCNLLLATYTRDAMKFLMLRQENQYHTTVQKLAEVCTNLLKHLNQPAETVIGQIETIMRDAYTANSQSIDDRIAQCKQIRNSINLNTFHGAQDDDRLVARIDALTRYKDTALSDIIFNVVTDTLLKAKDYGAIIEHKSLNR